MKAIRIHEFGGPQVMHLEDIERPVPAADEILVKVRFLGPQTHTQAGQSVSRHHGLGGIENSLGAVIFFALSSVFGWHWFWRALRLFYAMIQHWQKKSGLGSN